MPYVWKLPVPSATNRIRVPPGAKVLAAQSQYDRLPVIWYEADPVPDTDYVEMEIAHVMTGYETTRGDGWSYAGTCQSLGGGFVEHIYWRWAL